MSDQQRLMLTVLICFGIMMAWTAMFPPPMPPAVPPAPAVAPTPTTGETPIVQGQAPAPQATGAAPATAAALTPPPPPAKEELVEIELSGLYRARFTSRGARLHGLELLHPQYVTDEKDGSQSPIDLVTTRSSGLLPLGLTIEGAELKLSGREDYKLKERAQNMLRFAWSDPGGRLDVQKTYRFLEDRYRIELEVEVTNNGKATLSEKTSLHLSAWEDPEKSTGGMFEALPNVKQAIHRLAGEVDRITIDDLPERFEDKPGVLDWGGWADRYFLFAVTPRQVPIAQIAHRKEGEGIFSSVVTLPQVEIAPGESVRHEFALYIGPKELERLESEGDFLDDSLDFWIVGLIAKPLLWLMKKFHSWVGNWGLAIILLTIVVKLALFRWTQKSFKSMQAMQQLKPKMDALREKHAADKERMNQELLNLYKTHKINPLAGCLPMLLQMPVWIALYRTIYASVDLYRAPFFGWITDLSAEDPYYILPVALGVMTFVQQRLAPTTMDSAQQKMMMWMMPIMFTTFMLFLPSGLVLYIFANSVLTMIQQWVIKKEAA